MSIAPGSIVQLEREIDSPLDLLINGQVVARGEVVVVDGDFGLRIVEVLDDPQAD
jgi:flagellar motor switch protein FliN/FliY